MCKVYTGYHDTSEIEHGLCACTVDNPLAKAWGLSTVQGHKPCSISYLFSLLLSLSQSADISKVSILGSENLL